MKIDLILQLKEDSTYQQYTSIKFNMTWMHLKNLKNKWIWKAQWKKITEILQEIHSMVTRT